jgi:hypothetical protein
MDSDEGGRSPCEPPELVRVSGSGGAEAACAPGSSYAANCRPGNTADQDCDHTGATPGDGYCITNGSGAAVVCSQSGSTASNACSSTGSGAAF